MAVWADCRALCRRVGRAFEAGREVSAVLIAGDAMNRLSFAFQTLFCRIASMKTKAVLELADIKAIAAAAEAEALKNQWAVTIAIVDDGGHLLWLQRLDGAAALSSHIAPAKAHTAAMGRKESKTYEDVINQGRTSFLSAPAVQGMLEGGVPILKDGQCLGAVGVSGVKSSEDAQIARAGIAAIGL
jgi:glc operon protein GlcG